ncbi:MAG TPA: exosortase A [Burkholderiaceae bacterium]|nr:exosortase A [Burkholderiaceae bacterium]
MAIVALGRIRSPERAFAGVAAVLAAVAVGFWPTSASMVSVWSSSNTFSHGFFIVPVFLWLVWGRRHILADLPIESSWWALPAAAVAGTVWFLGHWMSLALPSQAAIVAMVPLAIAGMFGVAWVRALLFPLVFLFFAVPFGESLVPVLMDWTADFAVAALQVSGVPVYRDGLHLEIPNGQWSVVDSCSGIRYVFAALALSSLYGWLIYRSNVRRWVFVCLALVIAIAANWVRAYAIIMLGHLSDNEIAAGADHLVYGALFFVVIMAAVFALGAAWREKPAQPSVALETTGAKPPNTARNAGQRAPMGAAAFATWAVLLVWPLVSLSSASDSGPVRIAASNIRGDPSWAALEAQPSGWRPVLREPAAVVSGSFINQGRTVGVHIGLFGRSTPDSKLTSASNRLLQPDGLDPTWQLSQQGRAEARWDGQSLNVNRAVLVSRDHDVRLLAWQWYWADGTVTGSPLHASLLQLRARLQGRPEVSAWITIYTRDTGDGADASRTLQDFLLDMSTPIEAMLGLPPVRRVAADLGDQVPGR